MVDKIQSPILLNLGLSEVAPGEVTLILSNFIPTVLGRAFLVCRWDSKESVHIEAYAITENYYVMSFSKEMSHANVLQSMINLRAGYDVLNFDPSQHSSIEQAVVCAYEVIKEDFIKLGIDPNKIQELPALTFRDNILIEVHKCGNHCPKRYTCGGTCNRKIPTKVFEDFIIQDGESSYLALASTPVDDKKILCISKKSVDGQVIAQLFIEINGSKTPYTKFTGTPGEFNQYLKEFAGKFLEPKGAKWVSGD